MPNTPRLTMPYLVAGQAQKEITHNDALNDLDSLAQISVINRTTATPPATPTDGDSYIIASSPTGAWTGSANAVASYYSGWRIKPAKTGWLAYVQAESAIYIFDGTAWNLFKQIAVLGSAAAPAYSFVGDSDTGIYSVGANQLNFATGGVQRVTVDASGNTAFSGALTSGNQTITANSSTALAVGQNGTTNPALQVDSSVATSVNGLVVKSSAAGTSPSISAQGTDTNIGVRIEAKGINPVVISYTSTSTTSPATVDRTCILRNLSNTANNTTNLSFSNSGNFNTSQILGINESQTQGQGALVFSTGTTGGVLTQALKISNAQIANFTNPMQVNGNQAVNGPACSVYLGAAQVITTATLTKVAFNTKEFDTNTNFDATTNFRFTPTIGGYYQINANVNFAAATAAGGTVSAYLYKNGALFKTLIVALDSNTTQLEFGGHAIVQMNGSTDFIELYVQQTSGANQSLGSGASGTVLSASMIRGL